MPSMRIFSLLVSLSTLVMLAAQDDPTSGCTVGTLEDSCVSASQDNEVGHTPAVAESRVSPVCWKQLPLLVAFPG